jgi:superfamily II DNA/RNA helicase
LNDSVHTISFASLGVTSALAEVLRSQGIEVPFPIQQLTIADALAGRDVLGKAKTGSGKTLAFGLPLLMRIGDAHPGHPTGLVLVPTRELAQQVTEVLEPLSDAVDRRVVAVYGGRPMDRQIKALRAGADLVVGTPGRILDLMERGELHVDAVEVLVLDEADRMLDMGFLPQVQKILYRIERDHQTLLFSATLDGGVGQIVRRSMKDPVHHEVAAAEVTVDEMEHRFLLVHEMDKIKVAAAIGRGAERVLVFCNTKRACDRVARDLHREGVHAAAIHGDLQQRFRERALADFAAGRLHILVATDVAARGLDIDDVDIVVHYDPPDDHKSYLHRSGRTARAGKTGVAVTLMLWSQENIVRMLKRRIGVNDPIVEVFSNDPRLADLAAWKPQEV